MSEEQLKAFIEKLKDDSSLQEKLKAAADTDAVLAIAKEAGFMISTDDLKNAQSEISEEELEGVAGGLLYTPESVFVISFCFSCGCYGKGNVNMCASNNKVDAAFSC